MLKKAVYAGVRPVDETLVVPRGSRRWRVPVSELAEIVAELQERDVRYGAARRDAVPTVGTRRTDQVSARLAKGLEFEHVMALEPADIVAGEPSEWVGLRRLYVVLTRAVSGLSVVHSSALPAELTESRGGG